jgi:hypothetical protein
LAGSYYGGGYGDGYYGGYGYEGGYAPSYYGSDDYEDAPGYAVCTSRTRVWDPELGRYVIERTRYAC